jgi:hypothetical protein
VVGAVHRSPRRRIGRLELDKPRKPDDWKKSVSRPFVRDVMNIDDAVRVRTVASDRGLVSYMNDTKWREVCYGFRNWTPAPRFRVHDLLAADGYVSEWDREWYYHPRPYVSIQWLEVELSPEQIPLALALCKGVGAPVERTSVGIRIWGWVGASHRPQFA